PRLSSRCGRDASASETRKADVPARYGSASTTAPDPASSETSPAASNGRTVVAYATVTSRSATASSTGDNSGPTATTTARRPERTTWSPGHTGRASRLVSVDSRI